MTRVALLLAPVLLFAGAASAQQERQQEGGIMGPYVGQVRSVGPATVCGHAFAIRLAAGEFVNRQEGPDFTLFYVTAADGSFLLYEGGHPQPHDDEIRIGDYTIIAIHDNRSAEAKARSAVRNRLLTGASFTEACPQQRNSE